MPTQDEGLILLVEDEESWQRIIGQLLNGLGYQFTLARNYQEAIALLDKSFDLALVDAKVPESDVPDATDVAAEVKGTQLSLRGVQLVQALRAQGTAPLVLLLTGYKEMLTEDPLFLQLEKENEIYGVLEKTQSLEELKAEILKAKINAALKNHRMVKHGGNPVSTPSEPLSTMIDQVDKAVNKSRSDDAWTKLTRPVTGIGEITLAVKEVLRNLVRETGAAVAHILMPTPDGKRLRIVVDTGNDENRTVAIGRSITGRAYSTRMEQDVPDIKTEGKYYIRVRGNWDITSELTVPLIDASQLGTASALNGETDPTLRAGADTRLVLGVLNVESEKPFSDSDKQIVRMCAEMAAILFLREDRSAAEWRELRPLLGEILQELPDRDRILELVLDQGLRSTDAPAGFVAILENDDTFVVAAAKPPHSKGLRLDSSTSLVGEAIKARVLLNAADIRLLQYSSAARSPLEQGYISMLVYPIMDTNDNVFGALGLMSDEEGAFDSRVQDLGYIVADIAAIGLRQHQFLKQEAKSKEREAPPQVSARFVHQFNNLVGAIRVRTIILRHRYDEIMREQSDLSEALKQIEEDANAAMKIVKDLRREAAASETWPQKIS